MAKYDCVREMEIDGRKAIVSFFMENFEPTIDPRNALMVKVNFTDNGEQVFGKVDSNMRGLIRPARLFESRDANVPDFLIGRHGETLDDVQGRWSGWSDVDLTPLGIAQWEASAKSLVGRGIKFIITSPVRRARHSAEIAAGILGNIPIYEDWRLASWKLGILEGEIESDDKIRPYVNDSFAKVPGGGESLGEYSSRVIAALKDANGKSDINGPGLAMTHSSGIAMWQGGGDIIHAGTVLEPGAVGISHGYGKKIQVLAGDTFSGDAA
jgi:broad specificity phosphatase PhoE